MSQSVLIIGSRGMLGRALVEEFSDVDGYELTAWDREEIDITDAEDTRQKIVNLWPDIIINAAAYNAVDLCEENEEEYRKALAVNAVAPGNLAEIASGLNSLLVHYSSDYVFDGRRPVYDSPEGVPPDCCGQKCPGCQYRGAEETIDYFAYRENDLPRPLSRYGQTKLAGERAVVENTKNYFIIRLSKLFGPPALAEGAKKSFFDVMTEVGRKNKQVKVVDGETSCFTYSPDLARATRKMIEANLKAGIYHVVNEGAATWYEGVKELYNLLRLDAEIIPVASEEFPRPAPRAASSVLVNTKLDKSIAPLRPWQEALKEYLKKEF